MSSDTREIEESLNDHGYELLEEIGRGGYATVYKVKHKKYNKIFAMKVLENKNSISASYMNEINLLKESPHPNVISIYNYFATDNYLFITLEYCSNGSLMDLIRKNNGLDETQFKIITKQILSAVSYMHSRKISHGDIKPDNILFDKYNRPKLGDFGLGHYNISTAGLDNGYRCSPAYSPPEVLKHQPYDPFKADVWSIGVTCYQMIECKIPFKFLCLRDVCEKVSDINNWPTNNKNLLQILELTMVIDPTLRISSEDLLKKPYFAKQEIPSIKLSRNNSRSLERKAMLGRSTLNINRKYLSLSNIMLTTSSPKFEHVRLKTRSIDHTHMTFEDKSVICQEI